jgi:PadR family transcriptional regulator PadR
MELVMADNNSMEMLEKWEEVYKRGLLSFWLLLLLDDCPSYPREIGDALKQISQGTIFADDNSIYRALSRFEDLGIVVSEHQPSDLGPPRKYYHLTKEGRKLLSEFIQRNILVFENPSVSDRIRSVLQKTNE